MYIHKHYLCINVRVHEISGQPTSKPLHYQYKTTPSYTLVSGHPACWHGKFEPAFMRTINIITGA